MSRGKYSCNYNKRCLCLCQDCEDTKARVPGAKGHCEEHDPSVHGGYGCHANCSN